MLLGENVQCHSFGLGKARAMIETLKIALPPIPIWRNRLDGSNLFQLTSPIVEIKHTSVGLEKNRL